MAVYLGSNQVDMLGGGGTSDLSTVMMTVTSQKQDWGVSIIAPAVCDDETLGTCIYSDWSISSIDNPTPFQVVLYKGETKASVYLNEGDTISVSGDATFADGILTITGDCTIIIS